MRLSVYSQRQQWLGLLLFLAVTFCAAAIGSVGSINAPQFYRELTLPEWAPPGWLFGPVWTLLYSLMAIAAWLVWRSASLNTTARPMQLYAVQLALNALWSWLFFAWYQGAAAMIEILLLWVAIVATMLQFNKHSRLACWLLLPYLLWVSFASVLTYSLWQLNPHLL
ncbi:MAG: tryptophan-rich sensory protein [Alkalimonas sp.]|nr:tryptophan-rich sensory protein [Alkalimonas sp.]